MYITLTIILLICVGFGHVMVIVASSIRALTSQGEVVRRRDATQVNQRRGHSVQMYVPPYYIYMYGTSFTPLPEYNKVVCRHGSQSTGYTRRPFVV